MVNYKKNLSSWNGNVPEQMDNDRNYIKGPLYTISDVLDIIKIGESATILWTRKCRIDLQQMAFDKCDANQLIEQALLKGTYKNS